MSHHPLFHALQSRAAAIRSVVALEERHAKNPRVLWALNERRQTVEQLTEVIIDLTKQNLVKERPR